MHIFCLDYTVSVSKSYPLRVQNKLTTSHRVALPPLRSGRGTALAVVGSFYHLSSSIRVRETLHVGLDPDVANQLHYCT